MEKEFKTIEEQLKIIESRNITIEDYDKAYEILTKNNYYYLINGYKNLFLDNTSLDEKYINYTKIEELYALYNFDKNIKIIFLKFILLIESEIDTYIAYEFSKTYGHKDYLIPKNFNNIKSNQYIIEKFINDINLEIKYQYKSSNKMIIHYLDTYKNIPLWVLVRILSFGKISKFYSLMKPKEQNAISRKYNLRIAELKIYLQNLTLIRNICAHDEKLYDVQVKSRILPTVYHKKLNIKKNNKYQCATRDLFAVIIILKRLLCEDKFKEFYINIIDEIEILKKQLTTINIEKVLYKMGFPKKYKKLLKI